MVTVCRTWALFDRNPDGEAGRYGRRVLALLWGDGERQWDDGSRRGRGAIRHAFHAIRPDQRVSGSEHKVDSCYRASELISRLIGLCGLLDSRWLCPTRSLTIWLTNFHVVLDFYVASLCGASDFKCGGSVFKSLSQSE